MMSILLNWFKLTAFKQVYGPFGQSHMQCTYAWFLPWMDWICHIRPFHDSFIKTDAIGCEAQINRKVPPNENNFSWARLSLLLRLRPVKWARPAESLLSLPAHVFRICLKYSINSPVELATLIFISSRTCLISEENVNRSRENILEVWNMVHLSRTSVGVGEELRSTSPGFRGCIN